jgi:anthranilate synthase/aminodeoxychorismate synthase-like glutamine amidotransferase
MLIMIDNYDSFVYNLVHYVEELGETIKVYRNDAVTIDLIKEVKPSGIIISPGPKDPTQSGLSETIIREFASKTPILGVCLGHQAIAHTFGARIIKGHRPMHGKISSIQHTGIGVFYQLPSPMTVTRYHSLVIDESSLSNDFIITAKSDDGAIMGIKHKYLLLEGVQFHPEAVLTQYGHELLANFIAWCHLLEGDMDYAKD